MWLKKRLTPPEKRLSEESRAEVEEGRHLVAIVNWVCPLSLKKPPQQDRKHCPRPNMQGQGGVEENSLIYEEIIKILKKNAGHCCRSTSH